MIELKWIKLAVEIFDNRKIRQIESLPEGDGLLVIWLKLLCLAANVNDNGWVYFTPDIPYTDQMLATQFNRPLALVQTALAVFQRFKMIGIKDEFLKITNWEKYQSTDALAKDREQARLRQQRRRERLESVKNERDNNDSAPCHADVTPCHADVTPCHADVTLNVTSCHATDTDTDKDKEIDINNALTPSKYTHIVIGCADDRCVCDGGDGNINVSDANKFLDGAHVPPCTNAYVDKPSRLDTSKPAAPRRMSQDELFEQIWSAYPSQRKQGKERAGRAFRHALRSGVKPETISAGLAAYKRYIAANNIQAQYIKQGGTWFDSRGWLDEYPDTAPPDAVECGKLGKQGKPEKPERPRNRALDYPQNRYTYAQLREMGVDLGEDISDECAESGG